MNPALKILLRLLLAAAVVFVLTSGINRSILPTDEQIHVRATQGMIAHDSWLPYTEETPSGNTNSRISSILRTTFTVYSRDNCGTKLSSDKHRKKKTLKSIRNSGYRKKR